MLAYVQGDNDCGFVLLGVVTGSVEEMLSQARSRAAEAGVRGNVCLAADLCCLPNTEFLQAWRANEKTPKQARLVWKAKGWAAFVSKRDEENRQRRRIAMFYGEYVPGSQMPTLEDLP